MNLPVTAPFDKKIAIINIEARDDALMDAIFSASSFEMMNELATNKTVPIKDASIETFVHRVDIKEIPALSDIWLCTIIL